MFCKVATLAEWDSCVPYHSHLAPYYQIVQGLLYSLGVAEKKRLRRVTTEPLLRYRGRGRNAYDHPLAAPVNPLGSIQTKARRPRRRISPLVASKTSHN